MAKSVGVVVAMAAVFSGCHVYSPGNHDLAKQLQKSFQDIQIGKGIDDEREQSARMLASELEAAQKLDEAVRDNHLAILLEVPVAQTGAGPCEARWSEGDAATLACQIDVQLERLAGSGDVDALAAAIAGETTLRDLVASAKENIRRALTEAERAKLPDLSCTWPNLAALEKLDFDAVPEWAGPNLPLLKTLLQRYGGPDGACPQYLMARSTLEKTSGEIGKSTAAARVAITALGQAKSEANSLGARYQAAQKEYDAAASRGHDATKALAKLEEVWKKVDGVLKETDPAAKKVVDGMRASGLVGNPVEVAALEARVVLLTDTVRKVLQDEGSPSRDGLVRAALDAYAREKAIEAEAALPVLLLEAETARGQLARARGALAQADSQIAALQGRADGQKRAFSELQAARLSLLALTAPTSAPACAKTDLKGVVGDVIGPSPCGRAVASAMLHYANAWTVGFIPARAARLRYIGAIDRGALEKSGAALEMWERVLAVPMDEVLKFHSGGMRPEAIARILVDGLGFAGLISTTAVSAAK